MSSTNSSTMLFFSFATLTLAAAGTGLECGSENCTTSPSEAEDLSLLQALRPSRNEIKPLVIPGLGSLRGNAIPEGSQEYLNIPYAVPPGRFEQAKLNTSWPSVLDATMYGPECMQGGKREMSENCLSLNVWTPQGATDQGSEPLPVWFWIYGGGLISGANSQYNGSELSSQYKLTVVTVNYRLGALGFLSVGDEKSSGAMNGWHDTLVGLQWVKQHIAAFGGDPNKIYIGGESGGSILTCMHLFSPLTAAVGIAGVTLESGSCIGAWGPNTMHSSFSQSKEWLEKAMGAGSMGQLVKQAKKAHVHLYKKTRPYGYDCCGPEAVDGEFFTKLPVDSKFAVPPSVRVLLGSNSLDGLSAMEGQTVESKQALIKLIQKEGLQDNATDLVNFYDETPGLGRIVLPNPPKGGKWTLLLWQIARDVSNTCPTLMLAERLAEYGLSDVYLYWDAFKSSSRNYHGDELNLFWGSGYKGKRYNVTTIMGTQEMLRNFLYGAEPSTDWKSFAQSPEQQSHMVLKRNAKPKSGFERTACGFVRKFYEGPLKFRKQLLKFGWSG